MRDTIRSLLVYLSVCVTGLVFLSFGVSCGLFGGENISIPVDDAAAFSALAGQVGGFDRDGDGQVTGEEFEAFSEWFAFEIAKKYLIVPPEGPVGPAGPVSPGG